jgi:hypothetical protein
VRGWPGGEAWINTQSLLARKQFIDTSVRVRAASSMPMAMAPAADMMRPAGSTAAVDPAEQQRRAQVLAQRALEAAARVDAPAWLGAFGLAVERPLAADEASRIANSVLLAPSASPVPVGTLAFDALRATLLDPAYQLK